MDSPSPPPVTPDAPERRQFLNWLSKAFLGLWALGAAGVVGTYLKSPEREKRIAEHTVRVGLLEDLRVGEARLVRQGTAPFFVIRTGTTQVIALSAVCTHVRCILGFDRERRVLQCPCHDGRFDLSGNVLGGPPSRPLRSYEVAVRAGEVYVQL